MTLEEKIKLIEEILDTEEAITEDSVLDEIEEWDSMTKLALSACFKKQFNRVLSLGELVSLKTVGDICNLMQ